MITNNKHPFSYEYFNSLKTEDTIRAVARVGKRDNSLARSVEEDTPLRGFGRRYKRNVRVTHRLYSKIADRCILSIDSLNIPDEAKRLIRNFEMFQLDQKGPVSPVSKTAGTDQVVAPFLDEAEDPLVLESCKELGQEFLSLYEQGGLDRTKTDARKIDFGKAGSTLPTTSSRGFPFNAIGQKVDHLIYEQAGSSGDEVLEYFMRAPQNTSFTGVRLQGTPSDEEAKVRLISMADVHYQYINVGLVKYLQLYLRQFPEFAAWNDPPMRDDMIINIIETAGAQNCKVIPFDFSKFDRSVNRLLRSFAYMAIKMFYAGTDNIDKGYNQQLVYSDNQFIIFNVGGRMKPVRADNLLMSGVADTQLTGSLVNLAVQRYLQRKLGSPTGRKLNLALGDDVGMAISTSIIEKYSYTGLLEKIKELLRPLGFSINVAKAYPDPVLVFLQRLYLPEFKIIGIGSYIRTIASGMFKEKFSELPEGIRSLKALELLSQIIMLSDVEPNEILFFEFRQGLAKFGLERDNGLRAVIAEIYDSSSDEVSNADALVRYVIKLSTTNLNDLLSYFGHQSYDRYNLAFRISQSNYGLVFNFAVELIRAWGLTSFSADTVKNEFGIDVFEDDRYDSVEDFLKAE